MCILFPPVGTPTFVVLYAFQHVNDVNCLGQRAALRPVRRRLWVSTPQRCDVQALQGSSSWDRGSESL